MPLSTSNSNHRIPPISYKSQWATTLIILLIILTSLEFSLRETGLKPSVVDNKTYWSIHRKKLDNHPSDNQIVSLGYSRTQLGIDGSEFRKLKKYEYINLAIDGKQPPATLEDIANNTNFTGTIIYDFTASDNTPESYFSQQEFIQHYNQNFLNYGYIEKTINGEIAAILQSKFVSMGLTPVKMYNRLIEPKPNHIITNLDRTRSAYFYTRLSKDQLESKKMKYEAPAIAFLEQTKSNPEQNATNENKAINNYNIWCQELKKITKSIKTIQARGGNIVFVRYPTSGNSQMHREIKHPRYLYWDNLEKLTGAQTVHFQDIQGDNPFVCPESSHLNHDDATRFTKLLITELKKRKIIKTQNDS